MGVAVLVTAEVAFCVTDETAFAAAAAAACVDFTAGPAAVVVDFAGPAAVVVDFVGPAAVVVDFTALVVTCFVEPATAEAASSVTDATSFTAWSDACLVAAAVAVPCVVASATDFTALVATRCVEPATADVAPFAAAETASTAGAVTCFVAAVAGAVACVVAATTDFTALVAACCVEPDRADVASRVVAETVLTAGAACCLTGAAACFTGAAACVVIEPTELAAPVAVAGVVAVTGVVAVADVVAAASPAAVTARPTSGTGGRTTGFPVAWTSSRSWSWPPGTAGSACPSDGTAS